MWKYRRPVGQIALLAVLAAVAGCGAALGTVTGKVTYRGDAIKQGTVLLFGSDGQVWSTLIDRTGSYRLTNISPGPARVAVITHPRVPPGLSHPWRSTAGADRTGLRRAAEYVPVPERYGNPEQSGLKFMVHGGEQVYDIPLGR